MFGHDFVDGYVGAIVFSEVKTAVTAIEIVVRGLIEKKGKERGHR